MTLIGDISLVVAIFLTGIVAGAELGSLLIHGSLDRLPVAAGRPAAQQTNKRMGSVMPVLMPVTIVVVIAAGLLHLGDITAAVLLFATAVLLILMVLLTVLGLGPLNALEDSADEHTPEATWYGWRARWMRLHTIRVTCDTLALLLAASAAVVG